MTKNFAATRAVNGTQEPKLTIAQLWAGLTTKARNPKDFISTVVSSSIIEDSGDKVVREVVFQIQRTANQTKVTEHITFHEPASIIFHSENFTVTNLISFDEFNNLQLTFSFVGGFPDDLDEDVNASAEEMSQKAGKVVESSIKKTRELVKEGVL